MKRIFLVMLLISLIGCAHVGTVEPQLDDPNFQAQNHPYRTLLVCIVSEDSWPKEGIQTVVSEASDLMVQQVGIELKIVNWIDHPLPSSTQTEGLQNLIKIISQNRQLPNNKTGSPMSLDRHLPQMCCP